MIPFRAGLKTLREHGGLATRRVLHVERRIEEAYREFEDEPLSPLDEDDLPELNFNEDDDIEE